MFFSENNTIKKLNELMDNIKQMDYVLNKRIDDAMFRVDILSSEIKRINNKLNVNQYICYPTQNERYNIYMNSFQSNS